MNQLKMLRLNLRQMMVRPQQLNNRFRHQRKPHRHQLMQVRRIKLLPLNKINKQMLVNNR